MKKWWLPWEKATWHQTLVISTIFQKQMFDSIENLTNELERYFRQMPGFLGSMDSLHKEIDKLSRKLDKQKKKK
jgi:hypothetical protein